MTREYADQLLSKVARRANVSQETVRKEIEFSMEEAQKSDDPNVQRLWASIPHKGEKVTVEEFLTYLYLVGKGYPF